MEEWIKKVRNIYTLAFYSAVKNNDILNFACKWMEIENTILSEITQTQKDEYGHLTFTSCFIIFAKHIKAEHNIMAIDI